MSSKTPWTPGPWRLNAGNEIVVMDVGREIARARCGGLSGIKLDEAEANARLIAAAPEMAEAIHDWVAYLSDESDDLGDADFEQEIMVRFRALLSRIEGETK